MSLPNPQIDVSRAVLLASTEEAGNQALAKNNMLLAASAALTVYKHKYFCLPVTTQLQSHLSFHDPNIMPYRHLILTKTLWSQ